MKGLRNTPLQTRRARRGYVPIPGKVGILHPVLHVAPLRNHVVINTEDKR